MNSAAVAERQETAISEALWRVMSRGGPQSLTLRAVAAEAGCTTGLVTKRFPTKQSLLVRAREMLHERTAQNMDRIEQSIDDPVEALREVLDVAILGDVFDARIWLGYLAATLSDGELADVHVVANRTFLATVRRLVARIDPALPADEVETRAVGVISVITGVSMLATADPGQYSPAQMRRLIDDAVARLVPSA